MHGFETVKQELEAKRRQLEQELAAARGRVEEIQSDLERVDEAIGALSGSKKKSKTRSRSRKKSGPSVEDLQRHIESVREHSPFADANALLESVRSLVRQSGASLSSFESRFAEALAGSPGSGHARHDSFGHGSNGSGDPDQGPFS